jgi:putative DNA primase/helicase
MTSAKSDNILELDPNKSADMANTEDAVALFMVRSYVDTYRFSPGLGWLKWEANRWDRDTKLAHFNIARALSRARGKHAETDSDERRLATAKFVAGVVTLAKSDPRIVHAAEEFDADPLALNTPAGIVDLKTGVLRPHDHDLVTKVAAVSPDFTASRALWHGFLRDVFDGDVDLIDFMRRLLGYFLTGTTREQIIAFFHGTGANGKSTILDLMLWLLGSYACKLPAEALMAKRGDRHPTEIAQLKGVRLAVSNEIDEGEFWAESKLKELTGDQVLTARFMRMDFFTFNATHKHVIAGNHRPQMRAMDDAMRRRLVLVPFRVRFDEARRDRDLPTKLRAAGPAILADIIEGAVEWNRIGLAIPDSVRAASEEYATTMDSLGQWLADCCVVDANAECKASLLYTSYATWKRDRGEQPVSMTRWAEQMGGRRLEKYRNNGMRYRGLDLTPEERHRVEMGRP